jgi:hypothetical protein
LDDSLRRIIKQLGPSGALAVLAFGYRGVEIWREEFPRDFDALREAAKKAQEEAKAKAEQQKKLKDE